MELIFDSHAHYDSSKFDEDRYAVLDSMPEKGVCRIINCGSDLPSSERSIELAERYDFVYAAVGVHPHEASGWDYASLEKLRELLKHPKAVAIGEIGLDYHYDFSPRDVQKDVLRAQLALSKELDIPVILHDREAHGDMYDILREFAPLRGVMHCFSGSAELMRESIKLGLHIGLGGSVTFKNAKEPVRVAEETPGEYILLETDCPYMTPVPHRGERNDSSYIQYTAQRIAEIRGEDIDTVIRRSRENTERLFLS